jgi:hypothetical protein
MGRETAIERGKRMVAGAQSVFVRWAGDVGRRGLERGEHDRGEMQIENPVVIITGANNESGFHLAASLLEEQ